MGIGRLWQCSAGGMPCKLVNYFLVSLLLLVCVVANREGPNARGAGEAKRQDQQGTSLIFVSLITIGVLLLIVLLVITVLWFAFPTVMRPMWRSLLGRAQPHNDNASPEQQGPTNPTQPKAPQAQLTKGGTQPQNAEASKPLLAAELLPVQQTQEESPNSKLKIESQSSSHPISPLSKSVPDESEPVVNPKKVKNLGNIDQFAKEKRPGVANEIETGLKEDEVEDCTQDTASVCPIPAKVRICDERCILYESDDIPTADDVLEAEGADI